MSGCSRPAAQQVGEPWGAWQGGDAGTPHWGVGGLARGRAELITLPPRAALLEQRELQIKVLWAEWGSAPGLAWADTSPKG